MPMHTLIPPAPSEAAPSDTPAADTPVADTAPPIALTPRLARRATGALAASRSWLTPGFGSSTAYINLSPGLVCVFDSGEVKGLTHQGIGAAGMTAHQAWNAAAAQLEPRAYRSSGIEFMVRSPAVALGGGGLPPGFEVDGHGCAAASWVAHPRTFTLLHRHFEAVMRPAHGLVFATRDERELFVFDAPAETVVALMPKAAVMTYSVGFPLLHPGRRGPGDSWRG